MFSINLVFVDRKTIRSLNKKYRRIDKPTTVLSFYYGPAPALATAGKQAGIPLGEIVICPQEAKKQKIRIEELVVHGLKSLLSQIPTAETCRIGLG